MLGTYAFTVHRTRNECVLAFGLGLVVSYIANTIEFTVDPAHPFSVFGRELERSSWLQVPAGA